MLLSRKRVVRVSQAMLKRPLEETPRQVNERLKRSMRNSPVRKDPEAARKFLAQLSMYDKDGKLKKEF